MTRLSKTNAKILRTLMEKAFQDIATETGVHIECGRITFDDNSFKAGIKGTLADVNEIDRVQFEKSCWSQNLKPGDFGRLVTISGMRMEIRGINTRRHRYPISMKNIQNGKGYKVTNRQIHDALRAEKVMVKVG